MISKYGYDFFIYFVKMIVIINVGISWRGEYIVILGLLNMGYS